MLGAILGHAELAMDGLHPSDPLYGHLSEVRKAGERSAALTRQLLAFARKQTASPRVLDLNETVEGMLKMLRRLIGEDVQLLWLPGTVGTKVRMDPSQLDQMLANLCVNARDAINGTGKVTIETTSTILEPSDCAERPGVEPGEYVLLSVTDDGCGMNKETLGRLFEPFFTTKEQGKGTGLGLATVYGIVKRNRGFVTVDSELRKGTTFRIYLPHHDEEPSATDSAPKSESLARGNETILLVEDEALLLEVTRTMLAQRCCPGDSARTRPHPRTRVVAPATRAR